MHRKYVRLIGKGARPGRSGVGNGLASMSGISVVEPVLSLRGVLQGYVRCIGNGGLGRLAGNCPVDAFIAACTSSAAASMLRSRSNCKVICDEPRPLIDVICDKPAINEN